jgi:hypothetical protein
MTLGYGSLEEVWNIEKDKDKDKKKKKGRKTKIVDPVCKLYNSRNAPKDKPFNSNWVNNTKKTQSSKKIKASNLNDDTSIWTPQKYDVHLRRSNEDDEAYLDEAIYRQFGNHNRKSASQKIYDLEKVYDNYLNDNNNNLDVHNYEDEVEDEVENEVENEVEDEVENEVESEYEPVLIQQKQKQKQQITITDYDQLIKEIIEIKNSLQIQNNNEPEPCISELIIFIIAGIFVIILMENAISLGEKISIRKNGQ